MIKDKSTKVYTGIFLTIILIFVFAFYFQSLFYKVKLFDEITPFKETFLPSCFSLNEIFELVSLLGLKQHFEATNSFYSNIVSLRCNPFGNLLQMFIQYLFGKNPFNYHLYSLILHLINTSLVFLIIKNTTKDIKKIIITSILTLIWAIHPVNIESVLLLTNANIVLSYTFAFLTFYLYLRLQESLLKSALLFCTFMFALFTAEFHFILPFILILYTITTTKTFRMAVKSAMPLLIADVVFVISFLLSNTGVNINSQNDLVLLLERIVWLSPQILFHQLKLTLLPIQLSIDQTSLVKLGKSLFDPYSIFCICFIGIVLSKRSFFFIALYFLSLLPFSHIVAPLYNLASERYLYFPSFIFILGISKIIAGRVNIKVAPTITILVCILCILATRSYIRTLDWKDSFSLYYSASKTTRDPMYKAFRLKGLTPQEKIFVRYPEREVDSQYRTEAIENLKKAVNSLSEEKKKYQLITPEIIKYYGLDPATRFAKAGIALTQTEFSIHNNTKVALKSIRPYVQDLNILDSSALSFYGSILYYNNQDEQSEGVLTFAHKKIPYSTRITYPLCDLIQTKYQDFKRVEDLTLEAFKYFPYDTFTLLILKKVYELKKEPLKFAYFSYVYGLRHHSIIDLDNARRVYLLLNKTKEAKKAEERIIYLKKVFNK